MSKKGTKKATHHTFSLFLLLKRPEAPAALGAGGIPVYWEINVEVGVAVVLSVEPATFALEGSGVGREIGEAEPREAEGLYENGGAVGKSVFDGVDSVLDEDDGVEDVTVTVERMVDAESTADDDGTTESLVDVEGGEAAGVDEDIVGSATMVVVVVFDALDSMSEGDGSGRVGSVSTTVVVVITVVIGRRVVSGRRMEDRTSRSMVVSGRRMDERSPRSMVEPASSSALPSAAMGGLGGMLVTTADEGTALKEL
jgi:hypothetical protein